VLEYNVRFGDPETQPVMMRLRSDLVGLCEAALAGRLDEVEAQWDDRPALGVVMAAGGYPSSYARGMAIAGLETSFPEDIKVFHAGTRTVDGQVLTSGGRVLCVTALGDSVREAQQRAYEAVEHITWSDAFVRRDIGYRAIARESEAT
jgi:phosphoribosylamine--glycine ligase